MKVEGFIELENDLMVLHIFLKNVLIVMLLSVLNQEEMARLQENLEKLKAQGSEDDSEEKVNLKSRELNELKQRRF